MIGKIPGFGNIYKGEGGGGGGSSTYNRVIFNLVGSHTWTVPQGVNKITVSCVGGGGGGGGGLYYSATNGASGGGGCSGAWFINDYSVVGGDTISITVGAGGAGGSGSGGSSGTSAKAYDGVQGSSSSFTIGGNTYTCYGGMYGNKATTSGGGEGGYRPMGIPQSYYFYPGTQGISAGGNLGRGGAGGITPFGYGSGGKGGETASMYGYPGSSGKSGCVIIEWWS